MYTHTYTRTYTEDIGVETRGDYNSQDVRMTRIVLARIINHGQARFIVD